MRARVLIGLLLIAIVLTSGCTAKQRLIGTWEAANGNATITFNQDNTCKFALFGISAGQQTYRIEKDQLTVTTTMLGISSDLTCKFEFAEGGKTLILTFKGQQLKFHRKK